MNTDKLHEEIAFQLEAMEIIVNELMDLFQDVSSREPTVREKTAAAAFLAQFYNGIENILKRISHYFEVPLPSGDTWHVEFFQQFSSISHPTLPMLFDKDLAADLAPYRRFRHVVFYSYGFQLEWSRMTDGIINISRVFNDFNASISNFLES